MSEETSNQSQAVIEPVGDVDKTKNPFSRPDSFDDRYLVVRKNNHQQDIFKSAEDQNPVIIDRGDKLEAATVDRAMAMDLVELAKHRGWNKMHVKGPVEFRRELWLKVQLKALRSRDTDPDHKT